MFTALASLVTTVLLARRERNDFNAAQAPVAPQMPAFIESQEQLDEHNRQVSEWREVAFQHEQDKSVKNSEVERTEFQLKQLLNGMPNTWFKVTPGQGFPEQWVGLQTSNWPGDRGTLYLQAERPDRELRYQIIRD